MCGSSFTGSGLAAAILVAPITRIADRLDKLKEGAHVHTGQHKAALKEGIQRLGDRMKQALRPRPSSERVGQSIDLRQRAAELVLADRFDDAIQALTASFELSETFESLYLRAMLLVYQRQYEAATKDFGYLIHNSSVFEKRSPGAVHLTDLHNARGLAFLFAAIANRTAEEYRTCRFAGVLLESALSEFSAAVDLSRSARASQPTAATTNSNMVLSAYYFNRAVCYHFRRKSDAESDRDVRAREEDFYHATYYGGTNSAAFHWFMFMKRGDVSNLDAAYALNKRVIGSFNADMLLWMVPEAQQLHAICTELAENPICE
eukprot:TRINITY_DN10218_c0_g1_i1.p1 TRINITY_DN10218_c0_g1~~TRINITY_DN10218_c0_g1_i1.p1  ORF type:complete len:319 (+),score=57.16 TRINITY_DN10218_c0_g1_i1:66-1022(+)